MRTCKIKNCRRPVHISPTREYTLCLEHLKAYSRERYAALGAETDRKAYSRERYAALGAETDRRNAQNRYSRLRPAFWRALLTPWRRRYPLVSAEEAQRMYRLDEEMRHAE